MPRILGAESIQEDSCENAAEFKKAQEREENQLLEIQKRLSAQLGLTNVLADSMTRSRSMEEWEMFSALENEVGISDGIVWIKTSIDLWLDAQNKTKPDKNLLAIQNISVLTQHSPDSGIFIPLDFDAVIDFNFDGIAGGNIGSLIKAHQELQRWMDIVLPWCQQENVNRADNFVFYANNLKLMMEFALDEGLAAELF